MCSAMFHCKKKKCILRISTNCFKTYWRRSYTNVTLLGLTHCWQHLLQTAIIGNINVIFQKTYQLCYQHCYAVVHQCKLCWQYSLFTLLSATVTKLVSVLWSQFQPCYQQCYWFWFRMFTTMFLTVLLLVWAWLSTLMVTQSPTRYKQQCGSNITVRNKKNFCCRASKCD